MAVQVKGGCGSRGERLSRVRVTLAAKVKPRVAVLGKSRSILTWFEDLASALRDLGCEVEAIGTQAEGAA